MNHNLFRHLDWALVFNKSLKGLLLDVYKYDKKYLQYLDKLIAELRCGRCHGIRKKLKDVNLEKLPSIISELEIAKFLINQNKSVWLLPDNYMRGRQSPDIFSSNDELEVYIEVKRFAEDETIYYVLKELRSFLGQTNSCFRVDVKLGKDLSMLAIKWNERKKKREIVEKCLDEFKRRFIQTDLSHLPVQIKTGKAIFKIRKSGLKRGYPGIIWTDLIEVPTEKCVEKIRMDVKEKALKRTSWEGAHLKKFYVVAIDFKETWFIDEMDVYDALIGRSTQVMGPCPMPPVAIPRKVKQAEKRGWRQFLLDRYIIPHDRVFLDYRGFYFTRESRQISGVLARFFNNQFHFIPNPFASDEINDPKILNFFQ